MKADRQPLLFGSVKKLRSHQWPLFLSELPVAVLGGGSSPVAECDKTQGKPQAPSTEPLCEPRPSLNARLGADRRRCVRWVSKVTGNFVIAGVAATFFTSLTDFSRRD